MADAVLVIDMLRGFMEKGYALYCGDDARKIIPGVVRLLNEAGSRGSRIFFIGDKHVADDLEFRMFPPHCIAGTAEAELIPELASFSGTAIGKQRYSAFFRTPLEAELQRLNPGKLVVCGVCTDICVLHTVADARNRDYTVEVAVDCVASFNTEGHRWALDHMQNVLGAKLTHMERR
jgi:nicotinamidase-related amidase